MPPWRSPKHSCCLLLKKFCGGNPFALLLGDTIAKPASSLETVKYQVVKTCVLAVEEVPREKLSSYGVVKGKEVEEDLLLVEDLVEKSQPESAL